MASTLKLIRKQQHIIAARALSEWSKKHKSKDVPDIVLHVLNLAVEQCKLKGVDWTVAWIEKMIARRNRLEASGEKLVQKMLDEDKKEKAKARAKKKRAVTKKRVVKKK